MRPNRKVAEASRSTVIEMLEERRLFASWGVFPKLIKQDVALANFPTIQGQGQTIAVIDSGVDYNHPSLGKGFGPGHKVIAGYDFVQNDGDPYIGDANVHATGVVGVLAADPYDYTGLHYQGIAPKANIIVLRQNSSAQCKQALQWVIDHRAQYNIVAVNITDFLGATYQPSLYSSQLAQLYNLGVFIGSPAGNEGYQTPVLYPAADPNANATTSIDKNGVLPDWAQRDASLDMLGPGVNVTLTYYDYNSHSSIYTNYASGTSWASPHITGAAVLLKQINPAFTVNDILSILRDSGVPETDPVTGLTFPRLDLNAAITMAYARINGTGSSTPYNGSAPTAPGTIQIENYDNGGDGFGYHDTDASNLNALYRPNGVDIEASTDGGGGYDIGYTRAGEWLQYTVNVTAAGTYTFDFRVAAASNNGKFHMNVDGVNATGTLVVPNTGDWQQFQTLSKLGVVLSKGLHVFRLLMDTNGSSGFIGNFNWFRLTNSSGPVATPFGGTPAPLPGTIEVENFDDGGEGLGYHDSDTANNGGKYRSTGVDIESSTDTGGGYDVGWMAAGEWLGYTVNFTQAGTYTIDFRVAVPSNGGKFHLEIDNTPVTDSLTVPTTGGWQTWTTLSAAGINLTSGQHVLRLVIDSAGSGGNVGNFNWIKFTNTNIAPTPTAPTGLSATSNVFNQVALSWTDTSNNETKFIIERKTGSNLNWDFIANTAANATAFIDTTVAGGTLYTYRVRASNVNGDSPNSNESQVTTPPTPVPTPFHDHPFAIGDLIEAEDYDNGGEGIAYHDLDAGNNGGKYRPTNGVDIESTTDLNGGFDVGYIEAGEWLGYSILAGADSTVNFQARVASSGAGGTFHLEIDGVNVTGTMTVPNTGGWQTFTTINKNNLTVTAGQHFIKLVFDSAGATGYVGNLNWIKLASTVVVPPPAAPTNLTTTPSPTKVILNWTDNANNEDGYIIERSTSGGAYAVVGTTGPGANTFTDTTVLPNSTYAYHVRATNSGGDSANTANVAGNTPAYGIGDTIEAENFNDGPEGVAYHDTDAANNGGEYRATAVDIEDTGDTGGGFDVGWTKAGEYMNYGLSVATAGTFTLAVRVASPTAGGKFHVEIDGVNVSGTVTVPNTGDWQVYQTLSVNGIAISAGSHTVRLVMDTNNSGGFVGNFNWLKFS